MEMKQNKTFFHETYSNLTSFFIGHKTLKYFSDSYFRHISISLQKLAQASQVKRNLPYLGRAFLGRSRIRGAKSLHSPPYPHPKICRTCFAMMKLRTIIPSL